MAVLKILAVVGKQPVCPVFLFPICDYLMWGRCFAACLVSVPVIIVYDDIKVCCKPFGTIYRRQPEQFARERDNIAVFSAAKAIEMVVVQLQTACFLIMERT